MTITLIAPQEAVDWKRRGAATGLVQFSRSIGGAVLVAAMGAVLAGTLRSAFSHQPELIEMANAMMDPAQRDSVPLEAAGQIRAALNLGLGRTLIGVGSMGMATCLSLLAFPRRVKAGRGDESASNGRK